MYLSATMCDGVLAGQVAGERHQLVPMTSYIFAIELFIFVFEYLYMYLSATMCDSAMARVGTDK